MKKLILFVACLMVTSKSISQSVTKLNNTKTDSLVCIPKSIALKVISDLEKGDYNFKNLTILKNDLSLKDSIIYAKDSIIMKNSTVICSYEKSMADFNDIDELNQQTIKNLNLKLSTETKRKNRWKYIAGGFALLSIIVAK